MTAEFTGQLAEVLIREVPGLTEVRSVERLSGGASQETYRLTVVLDGQDTLLALRRAPGGEFVDPSPAHPGLSVEASLMRAAGDAGVPEPTVYYIFQRDDDLGDGFVMSWVGGEALGAKIVRSPEFASIRPQLAFECGRILALIHEIDLDRYGLRDQLAEMSPAVFLDQMLERYDLLDSPQPMIDYAAEWLRDHLPNPSKLTLVHNDFRNGNFLLEPSGISAVLDWEVAHIGDPMRDLGWICTNSWTFGGDQPVGGFGSMEDLFAGYESVTGVPVDPDHVRFWQVFGSFWWAIGCLGMAEHYRTGPDKTVERPAIGRRTSECQVDCVNLLIPGPFTLLEAEPDDLADMPTVPELVQSVRDFLRDDVMNETAGRMQFLARVGGNSLDIVLRDLRVGAAHRHEEQARLSSLLNQSGSLEQLRRDLSHRIRERAIPLDSSELKAHLRQTVTNQVAIDQPKYSGLKQALAYRGAR